MALVGLVRLAQRFATVAVKSVDFVRLPLSIDRFGRWIVGYVLLTHSE